MYHSSKLLLPLSLFLIACSQMTMGQEELPTFSKEEISIPNCEYSSEAAIVGIYHFQFPEVSNSDLVNIEGYKVHKMVSKPLQQMIKDARSQGVDLKIASAFRSIKYQSTIIERKKNKGQSSKQIYFVSAAPGFSEHHTGLAIDFYPINSSFKHSKTYQWLLENAGKYGFVQTFTEANSSVTGVSVESWHWKYIGSEQAKRLLSNGECYKLPKSQWQM